MSKGFYGFATFFECGFDLTNPLLNAVLPSSLMVFLVQFSCKTHEESLVQFNSILVQFNSILVQFSPCRTRIRNIVHSNSILRTRIGDLTHASAPPAWSTSPTLSTLKRRQRRYDNCFQFILIIHCQLHQYHLHWNCSKDNTIKFRTIAPLIVL